MNDSTQRCAYSAGAGTYVAPTATILGDVTLGSDCGIWPGAVIRADLAPITIGNGTNVQDNAVVHVSVDQGAVLGEGVTVGHGAIVHACTLGNNTLVGMGAIVLDGAVVGSDCIIGAGALVTQGTVIPDGSLAFGSPARVVRPLRDDEVEANRQNAREYVSLAHECAGPASQAAPEPPADKTDAPRIRRAEPRDIPAIARLLLQVAQVHADGRPDLFMSGGTKYTDDELARIIADDERPIFVATDEGDAVLGYAFCMFEDYTHDTVRTHVRTLYIDDICVDAQARGRHVGSALYEFVVDFARREGFYNVTLNVWTCNPGAQRFYEAMGMRPFKVGMEQVL